MSNDHNFETDTKLFQIRFHNVYMGEVWAADASSALSKAQSLYPDAPKHLFEIKFVANLYPVKKLTINDIRAALDARQVPYQDPCGDEHQLILRGTADIIEGVMDRVKTVGNSISEQPKVNPANRLCLKM